MFFPAYLVIPAFSLVYSPPQSPLCKCVQDLNSLLEMPPNQCTEDLINRILFQVKNLIADPSFLLSESDLEGLLRSLERLPFEDTELNQILVPRLAPNVQSILSASPEFFLVLTRFIYKNDRDLFKEIINRKGILDVEEVVSHMARYSEASLPQVIISLQRYFLEGFPADGDCLTNLLSALSRRNCDRLNQQFFLSPTSVGFSMKNELKFYSFGTTGCVKLGLF